MPIPNDCSWILQKILNLRPIALQHVKYTIGRGNLTKLWFDPWLSCKPLSDSPSSSLISNSGLGPNAMASSIICNSNWQLPASNHYTILEFQRNFDTSSYCNSACSDTIRWDDTQANKVTASSIWISIRQSGPPVLWSKLVWHKFLPPRLSFILWLAF